MAAAVPLCDKSPMTAPDKKAAAEKRAQAIYRRLMELKSDRPELSNNEWTKKAGVSSSFFTNLQGVKKPASEPSIGNLRAVLEKAGSSIPEFFVHEAGGRLIAPPTEQEIAQALHDAWPYMPRSEDKRVAYLAGALKSLLALPQRPDATPGNEDQTPKLADPDVGPGQSSIKKG